MEQEKPWICTERETINRGYRASHQFAWALKLKGKMAVFGGVSHTKQTLHEPVTDPGCPDIA